MMPINRVHFRKKLFMVVLCRCAGFFSSHSERGLFSSCGAQASHCSGSSCSAWALDMQASVSVAHGLICSTAREIVPDQGWNLCKVDSLPLEPPRKPESVHFHSGIMAKRQVTF